MEVIPAILVSTKEDFVSQIRKLKPFFSHFQIDIADGIFVPNKTITLDEIEEVVRSDPKFFKILQFDFDLMVENYEEALDRIDALAPHTTVSSVLPHARALTNYSKLSGLYPEFSVGMALDPEDSIETIVQNYDLESIPIIQIMSVTPGFQGQDFHEDTLIKIEQLRMNDYRNKISLDGGVNENTLPQILSKKYLPDIVCVGSFLTKSDDPKPKADKLKTMLSGQ